MSQLAFDHTGHVMATVDVRPNAGSLGSDEQSLRFWQRREGGVAVGSEQQAPFYAVNTFIDDPHRSDSPLCVVYCPRASHVRMPTLCCSLSVSVPCQTAHFVLFIVCEPRMSSNRCVHG